MKFSKRMRFFLVTIFMTATILPSCAARAPRGPETVQKSPEAQMKEIETARHVKEMNDKLMMAAISSPKDLRDYRIGAEDLLEITVFEDEKLNKAVRVSSQGNVSLPLLGILSVKGLTANELEKEIRDLLAEKYFQDPHVSVFIKEYRSQRISIMGAVEKPSVFDVTGQKTILDALAMAGGLKGDAGRLLFLIRPPRTEEDVGKKEKDSADPGANDPGPKSIVIDLDQLLVSGDLTLNLTLYNGDVINVPASGKVFVGGEVKTPGGFSLSGKRLTVSQAIALAGGLKYEAAGRTTKIFRYSGKGNEKEVLAVDVYAIQEGKDDDLALKENDIVMVPKSGAKATWNEIWEFLKGRIGGVSFGAL
jgi:polysaccharide biosynthesis/export protein